jgi:hypothetical protein
MATERTSGCESLIDLLERVLDKGIVIDAWVRVSPVDRLTLEADVCIVSYSVTPSGHLPILPTFGSAVSSRSALTDDEDVDE